MLFWVFLVLSCSPSGSLTIVGVGHRVRDQVAGREEEVDEVKREDSSVGVTTSASAAAWRVRAR